ncbi:acyl dehydratase [Sinorhizobium medicae]|uniref:MaoC family dehydratase n=1 Tax=Sinorhizobium medicae TaxID=110321 RepID=UPI0011ABF72E|nr:MaoC/PaaZ C-terminal domain-containing protein [Sinorhizobium medicae]TWA26179.1 acyl dehydratase [Sinorhizobium medicae]
MADQLSRAVTGLVVSYATTVRHEDIARFVALSGDDYEAHTDAEAMAGSRFGGIIAHGALLVGYMSAAGTKAIREARLRGCTTIPVSLGYDRLRFVAPVYPSDMLTVTYNVRELDLERQRSVADIEVTNQSGTVVAVAEHQMKWLQS